MALPNVGTNVPQPTTPTGTPPATPPSTPPASQTPQTAIGTVTQQSQIQPCPDPSMQRDASGNCVYASNGCPPGSHPDSTAPNGCAPDSEETGCPNGYYYDDITHKCRRITGSSTSDPFKNAPPGAISALSLLLGITPRPIAGMNPWLDEVGKHIMTLPNVGARGIEAYDLAKQRSGANVLTDPEHLAVAEAERMKNASNLDAMMSEAWRGFNKREAESIKNRASLYGTAGSGSTDAAINESFRDAYALPLMRESADRQMQSGQYYGNLMQNLGQQGWQRQYQNQSDFMNMLQQMEMNEKNLTKDAMELGWRQGEKVQGTEQAGYDAYMDEINRLRGYAEGGLQGILGSLPSSIGSTTSGGGK